MTKPHTKSFQHFQVLIISLAHHIHDIYTAFLAPLLPLLMSKYGITYSQAGMLSVVQRLPSLLNPFVGMIADKFRVRYFVIWSPALTGISMSLVGVAPGYTFAAILLLASGISSTMFHVPTPVMIRHVSGHEIGRGMSYYMLGGELARSLGPVIVLGAIELWTLEGTFKLVPLGIITSVLLFFRFKDVDIRKDFKKKDGAVNTGTESYGTTLKRFLPTLITTTAIVLFRGGMKSCLTLFLPTYLTESGAGIWYAGISLSVIQFAGAGGSFVAGIISDKIGRRNMFIITAIGTPALMFLFMQLSGFWILPVLIILGIFVFAPGPVMLAAVHDKKTENGAFINGVYIGSNFLINSINVLLIGWLADRISLELTFKLAIVWGLLVLPFVFRFKETKTK